MTPARRTSPRPWGTAEDLPAARRYRRWLVEATLPYLGAHPVVLAAEGDYVQEWADHGVTLTASEEEPAPVQALEARFAPHPRVEVRALGLPAEQDGRYSCVVAFNVLEHVPDDAAVLASLRRLADPGGALVVMVPACAAAMSSFDQSIGHLRRYGHDELVGLVRRAGWQVEEVHYVNSLGLLAWIVAVRLLRMTPKPGWMLSAWDVLAVPLLRMVEERYPPPIGKELFLVARLPADRA